MNIFVSRAQRVKGIHNEQLQYDSLQQLRTLRLQTSHPGKLGNLREWE